MSVKRGMTRRALVGAGIIGQLAFAVTFLAEDATRPGFDPWRRWVSHLSLGPWGWVNTVALAIGAASALAAALGLASSIWVRRGVAGYGIGLLLAAIFPIDPSLGWPPGAAAQHTLPGTIHQLAGALVFTGLTVAAWSARRIGSGRTWARCSAIAGVIVPSGFLVCVALISLDYAHIWPGAPSGLFERIALLAGISWLVGTLAGSAGAGQHDDHDPRTDPVASVPGSDADIRPAHEPGQ